MLDEKTIIALLSLRGVGARTVAAMALGEQKADDFESFEVVAGTIKVSRNESHTSKELKEAWLQADEVLEQCESRRIHAVGVSNACFPKSLLTIKNFPAMLFVEGNIDSLSLAGVAIIGTREPSEFGLKSAKRIASTAAKAGLTVISGLAEGCDTAGHQGCLEAGGVTIAVLAHGHGRIYPAKNKGLAEEIIFKGGALVSEYLPGSPPFRTRFVERDRLQSGLSRGIIVVETDIQGGTMHTVKFASEQNRWIGAIGHPPAWLCHPKSRGNQFLIEQNTAQPLRDASDTAQFFQKLALGEGSQNQAGREDHSLGLLFKA